jgi:hypothetical protein
MVAGTVRERCLPAIGDSRSIIETGAHALRRGWIGVNDETSDRLRLRRERSPPHDLPATGRNQRRNDQRSGFPGPLDPLTWMTPPA